MNGDIRAREILRRLTGPDLVGVEVGVFAGETSAELLKHPQVRRLYLVDNYRASNEQPDAYKASGDYHANTLDRAAQDRLKILALSATAFAADRRVCLWEDSITAAAQLPEALADFVFIDADHSYEGCRSDIDAWRSRVKPGGLLCGHDYDLPTHPKFGVKQAVDEAVAKHGWTLDLGENFTWFVRMP